MLVLAISFVFVIFFTEVISIFIAFTAAIYLFSYVFVSWNKLELGDLSKGNVCRLECDCRSFVRFGEIFFFDEKQTFFHNNTS